MNTIEIEKELKRTKKFLNSVPKLISELEDEWISLNEEYNYLQSEECDSDEYYGDELTELTETMYGIDYLVNKLKKLKHSYPTNNTIKI